MPKLLWAVRVKYLSDDDNKWHCHTTKWYTDSEDAWKESDKFLNDTSYWEASCSLIHKEAK